MLSSPSSFAKKRRPDVPRRVMHAPGAILSMCIGDTRVPERERNLTLELTFLSVTDTYVHTYTRTSREYIPNSEPRASALGNWQNALHCGQA